MHARTVLFPPVARKLFNRRISCSTVPYGREEWTSNRVSNNNSATQQGSGTVVDTQRLMIYSSITQSTLVPLSRRRAHFLFTAAATQMRNDLSFLVFLVSLMAGRS